MPRTTYCVIPADLCVIPAEAGIHSPGTAPAQQAGYSALS